MITDLLEVNMTKDQIEEYLSVKVQGRDETRKVILQFWKQYRGQVLRYGEVFMTPYRLCFNAPAKGVLFVFETFIAIYFISDVTIAFLSLFYFNRECGCVCALVCV